MLKKVILHLGQSKTGTSSLQKFLAENREKLAQQGVLYPDVFRGGVALNVLEHNSFADSLLGNRRYPGFSSQEYMQQFKDQLEEKHCDVLLFLMN